MGQSRPGHSGSGTNFLLWKTCDWKWKCFFLQGLYFPVSISLPVIFSHSQSVSFPSYCLLKAVCFSVWILSECDHKDCCFWLSNKNRCTVPDRNYKLLSTNTEHVPFSTLGWLEYISLQQSDRKKNKKMCHRLMAEITVLWFNEKWRHTVIWQFTVQWAGFTDEHHKWFYLCMRRNTHVALVYHLHKKREWTFGV